MVTNSTSLQFFLTHPELAALKRRRARRFLVRRGGLCFRFQFFDSRTTSVASPRQRKRICGTRFMSTESSTVAGKKSGGAIECGRGFFTRPAIGREDQPADAHVAIVDREFERREPHGTQCRVRDLVAKHGVQLLLQNVGEALEPMARAILVEIFFDFVEYDRNRNRIRPAHAARVVAIAHESLEVRFRKTARRLFRRYARNSISNGTRHSRRISFAEVTRGQMPKFAARFSRRAYSATRSR